MVFYKSARTLTRLAAEVGKADDIETAVHMVHFAGDAGGQIAQQIERRTANLFLGYRAAQGRIGFGVSIDLARRRDGADADDPLGGGACCDPPAPHNM